MEKYKFVWFILTLCATVCLTGCFSIDAAPVPKSKSDHLLVSNEGWFLFDVIPLAGGNANTDSFWPFVLFRNDVTLDKVQRRFMITAERMGKTKMKDLSYSSDESILFEIPGINFPIPIPYLLTYRNIQLSGVISKETFEKKIQPIQKEVLP